MGGPFPGSGASWNGVPGSAWDKPITHGKLVLAGTTETDVWQGASGKKYLLFIWSQWRDPNAANAGAQVKKTNSANSLVHMIWDTTSGGNSGENASKQFNTPFPLYLDNQGKIRGKGGAATDVIWVNVLAMEI